MSPLPSVRWGPEGSEGHTREARVRDAFALGTLVHEALEAAPSSEAGAHELDDDALSLGVNLLGGAGVDVIVAEVDGFLAGLARVGRREFLRAQHIADVQLLVHPAARGQGAGRALLEHVWEAFVVGGVYGKLAARVAADDPASRVTFERAGWVLERTERGALSRGRGPRSPGRRGARWAGVRRAHVGAPEADADVDVLVFARYAPRPLGVG